MIFYDYPIDLDFRDPDYGDSTIIDNGIISGRNRNSGYQAAQTKVSKETSTLSFTVGDCSTDLPRLLDWLNRHAGDYSWIQLLDKDYKCYLLNNDLVAKSARHYSKIQIQLMLWSV